MKIAEPAIDWRKTEAFTLTEVVVSLFVLGVMLVSLYAAFSSGFAFIQLSRENLRATQILVQKMEDVRLYRWSQLNSNGFFTGTFTTRFDPLTTNSTSAGTTYYCSVSNTNVPSSLPADYRNNMEAVTVTLYWTNYPQKPNTNIIVRSRSMTTYVAQYGMQNYNYNFSIRP